jgi:hypothetical protein
MRSILGTAACLALVSMSAAHAATGTLRGQVVAAPACPGPARLGHYCAPRPVRTTIDVIPVRGNMEGSRSRKAVRRVATTEAGTFRLSLPPGRYRLRPSALGPGRSSKPTEVMVTGGSTVSVTLVLETGLR